METGDELPVEDGDFTVQYEDVGTQPRDGGRYLREATVLSTAFRLRRRTPVPSL
jgi:hypothetical protein